MTLAEGVKRLYGRELTAVEVSNLNNFRSYYDVDDDDPIVVVLAMLAANNLMMSSLPELLQQKTIEIIELHRTTLREQSSIIAKELVLVVNDAKRVGGVVGATDGWWSRTLSWKQRWERHSAGFIAGVLAMVVFVGVPWVIRLFSQH